MKAKEKIEKKKPIFNKSVINMALIEVSFLHIIIRVKTIFFFKLSLKHQ